MDLFSLNLNTALVEPLQFTASKSPSSTSSIREINGTRKDPSIQVIACGQCRSRKVKCDSGRPICKNCTARGDTCQYDEARKRRGPDKQAAAGHRTYKRKPSEGHTVNASEPSTKRAKTTSSAAPLTERRVSCEKSAIANGQAAVDRVDAGQPDVSINTLLVPSDDLPLAILSNQESQDIGTIFPSGISLNDGDHAAGPTSLDALLKTIEQESIFPTPEEVGISHFTLESIQPIASETPQQYLQSMPFPTYQTAYSYYDPTHTTQTLYIPRGPSAAFYKVSWWEALLPLYSTDTSQASMHIYRDLKLLFKNAIYWLSFINFPWFIDSLFDPSRRATTQPSLVLSALAFATLMKSSETGLGKEGREFAECLRDAAQSSLEASLNVSWIEPSLAQAAFFLVLYEASSHPKHTPARTASALRLLDSLIQALSLTRIDANEIEATTFAANDIPSLASTTAPFSISEYGTSNPPNATALIDPLGTSVSKRNHGTTVVDTGAFGCAYSQTAYEGEVCFHGAPYKRRPMLLPSDKHPFLGQEGQFTPFCLHNGADTNLEESSDNNAHWKELIVPSKWPDQRDPGEMQKEESRRLCWSSIVLFSALAEYSPHCGAASPDFFVTKHENLALFFPGETIVKWRAKESIFALHCRTALLWNAYNRLRMQNGWHARRDELVGKVWSGANEIKDTLVRHQRSLGEGVLFLGREYFSRLKTMISSNFTRLIPLPNILPFERDSAKEWLSHREVITAKARQFAEFVNHFGANATALALSKRFLGVWWAMYQIQAGLLVWKSDTTLVIALKQSLDFLAMADFLTVMWPSEHQRQQYAAIRTDLLNACAIAGIRVPEPIPIPGLPEGVSGMMTPSPFFSNKPSASDIVMAPLD